MLNLDNILQAWIVVTGVISIWLITSPGRRHARIGCAIGLIGQPAWLISTAQHVQWGQLLLTLFFTFSYLRGAFPSLLDFKLKGLRK